MTEDENPYRLAAAAVAAATPRRPDNAPIQTGSRVSPKRRMIDQAVRDKRERDTWKEGE